VALGIVAYRVQVEKLGSATTSARAASNVAACWSFLFAGLLAWSRRPANHLGPLMMLTGFSLLGRQLRYSHDPLAFTVFYAFSEVGYALFAHTALAYPSGRVTDRIDRAFLKLAYFTALAFPIATLLVYDGSHKLRYFDPFPRESVVLIEGNVRLFRVLQDSYAVLAYGVLASLFVALAIRRLVLATPRARRMLAPLLLAAVAAGLRAVYDSVITFSTRPPAVVYDNLFWWQIASVTAVPVAMVAGMLRARLARANLAEVLVELEGAPAGSIQNALARVLDDPSLEVAFWLPDRREYVDGGGRPVTLPEDDSDRAVTRLEHDGVPVAALVHDPSLLDEPRLVEGAGAAARLALENARLHAELQAQLTKVQESRARIVAAEDEQRRRIERNLHDGAQQRLVALALELRRAQRGLGEGLDPQLERLLRSTADELQVAVQELRNLAAGIHPPVLTQSGLAVALDALAQRAPLPVTVDARVERLPAEIEGAGYFVAAEALANVAKHAEASRAAISASVTDGRLVVEIVDDGVGGAAVDGGTGLRGLVDRVEARGGRLAIESPPGGGTRVTGEIPCAS
jgi:signal transduction histidine kinase